ncbi:LPXTG cell wall anchor domain-containing protein [Streptomyces sp. B6B3]|uniref:LPXTG cell wall anchor domain-containing protein n=1 Tax=Streptomyces sp. B6B3 TaxID=3153570 RepID=UPI00325DBB65
MKKSPRSRSLCRLTAASALLALGIAGPATAARAVPADDTPAPLVVSPSAAGAGSAVTVRAACLPSGPARSEAFEENVALRQHDDGTWSGVGRLRASGLQIGRAYPVTVLCADGVTLSATLSTTAGTPDDYLPGHPGPGAAAAGFGDDTTGGDTQATALAVGGGVAVAGAVAYLLLARRRRAQHRYF